MTNRNTEYRVRKLQALRGEIAAGGMSHMKIYDRLTQLIEKERQLDALELSKEEWYRYIEEAVCARDWIKRLFGNKRNYRDNKRRYGKHRGDSKGNPELQKAVSAVMQYRHAEVVEGNAGFEPGVVAKLNFEILVQAGIDGKLHVVRVKIPEVIDFAKQE